MKLIYIKSSCSFEVIADTALVTAGKPTFVPDVPESAGMVEQICFAVRLSRLGKTIAPKFAPRYYDAVTLASRLLPIDGSGNIMTGWASVIDYGVTVGQWIAPAESDRITVEANGLTSAVESPAYLISSTIASLSEVLTVKTGDIILLPIDLPRRPIAVGDTSSASLGGNLLLNVRFK